MSSQFLSKPAARPTGLARVDAGQACLEHGIVDIKCCNGGEHAPGKRGAQGHMPDRMRQIRRQGEQCRSDEALINRHAPPLAEWVLQAANRQQIFAESTDDGQNFRTAHLG